MVMKKRVEVRPLVLVVTQAGETREYEFKQESVIIGNGPTANVALEDESVSSIHAIIKLTLESATIIDLGSETGTFINGKQVRESALADGDALRVGSVEIAVQLPTPLEMEQVARSTPPPPPPVDDDRTVNFRAADVSESGRKMPPPPPFEATEQFDITSTVRMTTPPSADKVETKPERLQEKAPAFAAQTASAQSSGSQSKPQKKKNDQSKNGQSKNEPAKQEVKAAKIDETPAKVAPSKAPPPAPTLRAEALPAEDSVSVSAAAPGPLPELAGKLNGVALNSRGIPEALSAAELQKSERPTKEKKVLQVAVYWGDQLMQALHFGAAGAEVTIGEAAKNDIVLAADGLPDSFIFVRVDEAGAVVNVPDAFPLEVRSGKDAFDRKELKAKGVLAAFDGQVQAQSYRLSLLDRALVRAGSLTLSVQYVSPAQRITTTLAQRMDQAFVGTTVFVSVFAIFFCLMVAVAPKIDEQSQDDLFRNSARFAKLLLKEEKKMPKKFELSGSKGGGKHKDDEGKFGKKDKPQKDALASAKGAPKVDPNKREKDRKIAMNAGILGALKGGKNDAVSNVFGPGGLGTGINSALGGLRGTAMGDAGGAGGLGSRGAGPGGGGSSLGIGGIGNGTGRGTGGLGNVDLGGRGKGEHAVDHSKTVIQGGLSQDAIGRVLDRAKSAMRFCYEKELQRVPDLYGKVTVKFEIGGTGSVTDANVALTTLANINVEECLLRVYRRLKFPQPAGGGTVNVNYPMVFNKTGNQ